MRKISKGFTLIELLIALAVVGGLAGMVMLNYPTVLRRARDTQRKSDLKQYQTALEVFANKQDSLYPRRNSSLGQPNSVLCSDINLTTCPNDPRDGTPNCAGNCGYRYQTERCGSAGEPCATNYVLWAPLEQTNANNNPSVFVVCSNGNSGETDTGIPPSLGVCPI